jgi:hypothetical protein
VKLYLEKVGHSATSLLLEPCHSATIPLEIQKLYHSAPILLQELCQCQTSHWDMVRLLQGQLFHAQVAYVYAFHLGKLANMSLNLTLHQTDMCMYILTLDNGSDNFIRKLVQ